MDKIGALVLAAGASSRLGQPKQLLQFRGQTLLCRAVDAALEANCAPAVVVLGAKRDCLELELHARQAILVENSDWERGIGTSIRAGVRSLCAAQPDLAAIAILACDQPHVDSNVVAALIALRSQTKKRIIAAAYSGTAGIPALFDRRIFAQLLNLADHAGAKAIIESSPHDVALFPFPEGAIDIDTAADYERFVGRGGA